jgi:lysine decarboxylase
VTADSRRDADQDRAPLLDALERYARGGIYPLHTPGHKNGRFADADLIALVGRRGLALDLPSMMATDNTFHPAGCIRDAQALAARLVGAQESFFLTGGSTLGVAASLLACASRFARRRSAKHTSLGRGRTGAVRGAAAVLEP